MPLRPQPEDEAVLRTDGSIDQTAAYAKAEHVFDPSNPPTQEPTSIGPKVKKVWHQQQQVEESEQEALEGQGPLHHASPTDI